ncbi:hypothetical protein [Aliiruegeria lutimaris]|uniref:Dynamin family protein n=1 Tax=Aliiruegeria lutimaris TaxID=571298 RepID=A0A1G8VHC0_9RHOB|nr:hypothetical protein [Aliiruegeria lutimaris]SDJ64550.1 hypothetical protein SAMN04488026_102127 [Aliiruegeria lutimaris]
MTEASPTERIAGRLRDVIDTQGVPSAICNQARRYLERLEAPLRIAFMGPANSGQPRLINAMLGADLIPESGSRPVQELVFGAESRVTLTRADGSVHDQVGTPAPGELDTAVFVQRQCDAPVLRQFTVLDLMLNGTPTEMRAAVRWAASKADMAVWCSRSFSKAEQQFWLGVPERLMDHAFLVLSQDTTGSGAEQLKRTLGGEFLDVLSVPITKILASADDSELRASALGPLMAALERHASDGRRADAETALMFLKKHEVRHPAVSVSKPADSSSSHSAKIVSFENGPSLNGGPGGEQPDCTPRDRTAIRGACAYIREQAGELLDSLQTEGAEADFTARCSDMIRQLMVLLDSEGDATDPEIQALSDVLIEAEELVLLLELEQDGTPEIDAACVLIQLRTEFETLLAA